MKNLITKVLPALFLAVVASTSFAAEKKTLSYNYAEVGVNVSKDIHKHRTDKSGGSQFNLSFEVGPSAFILLGVEGEQSKKVKIKGNTGQTEAERFNRNFVGHFGFGGYAPLLKNLDLVGEIVYLRSEFQDNFKDKVINKTTKTKLKDNGWGAGLGVRSLFADWFELNGFVRHADILNEKNTIVTVGARAHMSLFSIGLDISEHLLRSNREKHHVDLTARFRF